MGRKRGRRLKLAIIGSFIILTFVVGGYAVYAHVRPYLHGTNCEVHAEEGVVPLDLEQASNAATIAAVSIGRKLPEQAAVIAYATAMQESHLHNLDEGDRDSVGLFQQRPSQGWGTEADLKNPVYATSQFFDALVKVKGYFDMPIEEAAQKVQRSADGNAYARHESAAEILAAAFTGREPATMRCWYPPNKRKEHSRRATALHELRHTLGRRDGSDDFIKVTGSRSGWATATWLVAHAQTYGLKEVRFAGRHWRASNGHDGWTSDDEAPDDRVLVR